MPTPLAHTTTTRRELLVGLPGSVVIHDALRASALVDRDLADAGPGAELGPGREGPSAST